MADFLIRADLHIHTRHSPDCAMSAEGIVRRCLERRLHCIAITDHNTIDGGLEVQKLAPFQVIVGEEIRTLAGEIIGFFLTDEIPRHLAPEETVRLIKAQGGLVCIPHPFDRLRRSPIKRAALESLVPEIDVLEVFNSRTILASDLARARLFAEKHGLLASAGSDAHTFREIGKAYVEMPAFDGPQGFKEALAQGKVIGQRSSPLIHLTSGLAKLTRLAQIRAA